MDVLTRHVFCMRKSRAGFRVPLIRALGGLLDSPGLLDTENWGSYDRFINPEELLG